MFLLLDRLYHIEELTSACCFEQLSDVVLFVVHRCYGGWVWRMVMDLLQPRTLEYVRVDIRMQRVEVEWRRRGLLFA